MFWESRGFWYTLFLFLHGGSHERQQGAEQHRAAEEIPEVRLSDQVTDGKYSRSKTDHDIAWIKPFFKACPLGHPEKYQPDDERDNP